MDNVSIGEVIALAKTFGGGGGGSSGGGVLEITIDSETFALNHTWQEIHDAMMSGKLCILMEEDDSNVFPHIVTDVFMSADPGGTTSYGVSTVNTFASTDSANGYPVWG